MRLIDADELYEWYKKMDEDSIHHPDDVMRMVDIAHTVCCADCNYRTDNISCKMSVYCNNRGGSFGCSRFKRRGTTSVLTELVQYFSSDLLYSGEEIAEAIGDFEAKHPELEGRSNNG